MRNAIYNFISYDLIINNFIFKEINIADIVHFKKKSKKNIKNQKNIIK